MKKMICLLIATVLLTCFLSSCSTISNDPMSLAKQLKEEEYSVQIVLNDEFTKQFADEYETRSKGIYCIMMVAPVGEKYDSRRQGIFLCCDSTSVADRLAEDLEDYAAQNDEFKVDCDRGIVEKSGKIVFIGCEDVWETLK